MAKDMFWTTTTFSLLLGVLIMAFWPNDIRHVTVKYDCHLSEISPDYPVAVKQACRKKELK